MFGHPGRAVYPNVCRSHDQEILKLSTDGETGFCHERVELFALCPIVVSTDTWHNEAGSDRWH